MSMNFKKTAIAAGMFTALAATSMSANAMRETEAGEANLVPFVLWDNAVNGVEGLGINTVVKITVPKSVGNNVIPNYYTAIHSSPTNGTKAIPGPEDPAAAALEPSGTIHWYFMDQKSQHVLNGTIKVTPDDVHVIDWGSYVRQNGLVGTLNGKAGYLVLTTQKAAQGFDADFSFFAEAWVIAGLSGVGGVPNSGGVIGLIDAKIPVMPMSDGADNGSKKPTVENSVIETGVNLNVIASPLVAGIGTSWSDGNGTDIGVVDVTLGNRSVPIGGVPNVLQVPTLVVVWNDRNAANWNGIGVDIYNDSEEHCSTNISLPWQLNLVWVQTDVTAGNVPGVPAFPVPEFISTKSIADPTKDQGQNKLFCVPPYKETPVTDPDGFIALDKLLQGGFMKLYLPEPIDTGIGKPESAMVAFSIPLQYNAVLESAPAGGGPVLTDFSLIPFETALGHSRGMFSQAP